MIKPIKQISFCCLASLLGSAAQADTLALPATWTHDLEISVYSGGGKSPRSLEVTYTAESGKYDERYLQNHQIHDFPLSAQDKQAILRRLRGFGLERVVSTASAHRAHDKPTTRICVMHNSTRTCVQSSGAQVVSSNNAGFIKSYDYLVDFAKKKQSVLNRTNAGPAQGSSQDRQ